MMKHRFLSVFVFSLMLAGCGQSPELVIYSGEGDWTIDVEVAETEEEKRIGLMGRTALSEDEGMLFVYDSKASPVMWMKNMLMPIDMLFISEDLTINHLEENLPPCLAEDDDLCDRYSSFELSFYVLELPAGAVQRYGLKKDDRLELKLGV